MTVKVSANWMQEIGNSGIVGYTSVIRKNTEEKGEI